MTPTNDQVTNQEIVEKLKKYFSEFKPDHDEEADFLIFKLGEEYSFSDWFYSPDFNLEINHQYKLCAVRCGDDFHICAVLPYDFQQYSIQDIVAAIWPSAPSPEFYPPSVYNEIGEQISEYWLKRYDTGMKELTIRAIS